MEKAIENRQRTGNATTEEINQPIKSPLAPLYKEGDRHETSTRRLF
jgi:hypothetical protein